MTTPPDSSPQDFTLPADGPAAAHSGAPVLAKQIVAYFTGWGVYGRNYLVKDIVANQSADKLTVINYAFGSVAPDASGQVVCQLMDEWADYQKPWDASQSVDGQAAGLPNRVLGNFQQLKALKALYPHIKVMISVGGWTLSKYFSDAALTPESRQVFAQSCIDLFIRGNLPGPGRDGLGGLGAAAGVFDGIDVDWEYPGAEGYPGNIVRAEDTRNFTLLMAEFRKQLDQVRPGLLLTFAAPAPQDKYVKIELQNVSRYVDWINLMTYDFHTVWDTVTNFQSNLLPSIDDPAEPKLSIASTVRDYLEAGVPPGKLIIGAPFYGHGWTGVTDENAGLYQPVAGPAPATWEAGSEDYKVLKTLTSAGGYTRYWDPGTRSAWLFDGRTFWTYDDEMTIAAKIAYIRDHHLGGMVFWELSGDDGTLINAAYQGLKK